MRNLSNEQLCQLARQGNNKAKEKLLQNNMRFIHKQASELLQNNNPNIEIDDLIQEGCLGLLNAIAGFEPNRNIKFLTYAAPAIRNAMLDFLRNAASQFENKIKSDSGLQIICLDDVLTEDERQHRIETIADPAEQSPEQIYIDKETLLELYAAIKKLTAREQTYLLYRYGFLDDTAHNLTETARHFHLSLSRTKATESQILDNLWLELPW